jgi:penicillin amidase
VPARRQRTAIAGGIAAGALAGTLAGVRHVYRGAVPPHDGRATVPGLGGAVEIVRDSDGIPHIRAGGEGDALAGLGYCHAQDRLWQMELIRRIIRGTLAELVGKTAIETDRYARTLGLGAIADAEADGLAGDDRAAVEAYCRGVNGYLEGASFRLPLELRLLVRRRVAPWTVSDALLGMRVFALTLSQNWEGEIVRSRLAARLGAARLEQLEPGYPGDGYTSLPAGAADAVRAALELRARAGGAEGAGSNNWVLSADRTTTGAPLLANDPHLLLAAPCTWYAADIAWDGERAAGLTLAGTPGILIGQTAHAAWGFTNVEADTQDLLEVTLDGSEDVRTEAIAVRGRRSPVEHEVVRTAHGPVVTPLAAGETTTFALQWTALRPAGNVGAFRAMVRARSADDLVAALAGVGGATLNCVYATLAGEIGYQMCGGPIPIRASGDGRFPTADAWVGTVPYEELPAWRDPEAGAIVTANNRIVPDDYPHLIATEWLNPYRAQRIADLLAERERHGPDDLARIQTDIRSLPLMRLRDLIADVEAANDVERRALGILAGWHGEMRTTSAGAAIAATLFRHLTLELYAEAGEELERFLGAVGFSLLSPLLEFFNRTVPGTLAALEQRDDGFFRDGRTWRGVLAKCLTRACVELERQLGPDPEGWTWGDVHVLVLDHPLAALPGLERVFRRGPFPLPGEAETVWAAAQPITDPSSGKQTSGPGTRFVANLADPDESLLIICGGQSGHPASARYDDQLDDWLAGRMRKLNWSDAAVERNRAATLTLDPA